MTIEDLKVTAKMPIVEMEHERFSDLECAVLCFLADGSSERPKDVSEPTSGPFINLDLSDLVPGGF